MKKKGVIDNPDQGAMFAEDRPDDDVENRSPVDANHAARFIAKAAAPKSKRAERVRWIVSVHPFDDPRNLRFKKTISSEADALAYIERLKGWVKTKGNSILLQKDDLVWHLWSCDGVEWEGEAFH